MTPFARATRRTGLAALLLSTAVLAAACASRNNGGTAATAPSATAAATHAASASPSAPQPGGTSTASATPSAGTAACATANLKAAVVTGAGGAAAGSAYYPVNLTNTGSSSCSLFGYPGVSWVTSPSGNQIGQPARRNPVVTPAAVVLAPGQTAHVTLQVVDAQNFAKSACQPVTAHWLKIYPPGQFSALYVKFSALTCSAKLPSNLGTALSVDAVKAGEGKAGGGL